MNNIDLAAERIVTAIKTATFDQILNNPESCAKAIVELKKLELLNGLVETAKEVESNIPAIAEFIVKELGKLA